MKPFIYLYIDNSLDRVFLRYWQNGRWQEADFDPRTAGGVLGCIHALLKKLKLDLSSIHGLAVRVGAGRFTAARIATTVANTLAFALQVPIIGVAEFDGANLVKQITAQPMGVLVSAKYSGQAHIGGKN